jgi:hypothetical protein
VKLAIAILLCTLSLSGCAVMQVVRLQDETIAVAPGLRPMAGIQASATSLYVAFIPIPGGVSLDRVVNQMLVVQAKTMGADKVVLLGFDVDPDGGVWALWKLLGWRSAHARGIAVQVVGPPPDTHADDGPEPRKN